MPHIPTLVRTLAAVSLIVTLFASVSLAGSAQTGLPPDYPKAFAFDANECYFASVSNGENFGLGASQTSVTIQNLDNATGVVYLSTGIDGKFVNDQQALLAPYASKTFSAASLKVPTGATAAVVARAYTLESAQDKTFKTGIQTGCVAKQAVAGSNLPTTTANDTAVSGYNATSGREVGYQHELYLPIVQTNCGPGGCWNTKLRVANVGPFDNASVTIRFFPADEGQGSLDTGFQVQESLGQGETATIDLRQYVDDGWVGSAHIYTDDRVVAIADRYKVGTDMWITNTASNATAENRLQMPGGPSNMPYVLFAPDVRLDYNAWNTGISVANTVNADNTVNIQYFGSDGNAPQAQTQRLSAHGMTYFYNPSRPSEDACAQPVHQVVTCDFVGGAVILSQSPVAVAVDGVKYFGNDHAVGQAFSYNATGNVFTRQAAPLVQKGSPATGMGATSGITFLNVNAQGTYVTTSWYNPSGADASNAGDSVVWVPANATGFVYTMTQRNVPNGFTGSAVVISDLPIAATSANVDYQVTGDGTAIWNLYNPCGLYRQVGDCPEPATPEAPATKNFSVRPASANAWICAFNTTYGQSDGKPEKPAHECVPNWVFDKGASDDGQSDKLHYVALSPAVVSMAGPTPVYTPEKGSFISVEIDTNLNSAKAWFHKNGAVTPTPLPALAFYAPIKTDSSGAKSAANFNLVCSDAVIGPNVEFIVASGMTGTSLRLLGIGDNDPDTDPENALVYAMVGSTPYCGQLEAGQLRLQSAEELGAALGTTVTPVSTDNAGMASITLEPGCYTFVVSAEGYGTQSEVDECLDAGEVKLNSFDLASRPASDMVSLPVPVRYVPDCSVGGTHTAMTPVQGPGTPPLGTGSLKLDVDVGNQSGGANWQCGARANVYGFQAAKLSDLQKLNYCFFIDEITRGSLVNNAPWVFVYLDVNGDGVFDLGDGDDRFAFEPGYNLDQFQGNQLLLDTWYCADVVQGTLYLSSDWIGGNYIYRTFDEIQAMYPDARIIGRTNDAAGIQFGAGLGGVGHFTVYIDNVVINFGGTEVILDF